MLVVDFYSCLLVNHHKPGAVGLWPVDMYVAPFVRWSESVLVDLSSKLCSRRTTIRDCITPFAMQVIHHRPGAVGLWPVSVLLRLPCCRHQVIHSCLTGLHRSISELCNIKKISRHKKSINLCKFFLHV